MGALPLDPTGGSAPRPRYRLVIHALAMCVHPTFFDLVTPLVPALLCVAAVTFAVSYDACCKAHNVGLGATSSLRQVRVVVQMISESKSLVRLNA